MKLLRNILLYLTLVVFISINASAQIKYSGKHFFFSLGGAAASPDPSMGIFWGDYPISYLQFASAHHATINLHYTTSGTTDTYTLIPFTPFTDSLTGKQIAEITDSLVEQVHNNTLEITSDSDITVSFMGGQGGISDDAMSILPCDGQRSSDLFYLLGITAYPSLPYTYSIVSNSDSVTLQITPTANTVTHVAGIPYIVHLNKGDEYRIANACDFYDSTLISDDDISGTKVEILSSSVCMPIDIYVTYDVLELSYPLGDPTVVYADILLEEIMPATWWDTLYPVIPYPSDSLTILRVLSSANANNIYYNNVLARTLNTGQFFDTVITSDQTAIIHSTYPIGVAQFMTRDYTDEDLPNGDPDMLWCYSQVQGIKDAVYTTFLRTTTITGLSGDTDLYTLAMVSKTSNIPTITVNGSSVSSYFIPFAADTSFSYANIPNTMNSTYHIHSAQSIIAYQIEQEDYGSYSYNLSDLGTTIDTLTQIDTVLKCKGFSIELTTTLASPYSWSTGDTTSGITVPDGNSYYVTGRFFDGCDTSYVKQIFFIVYRTDSVYKSDTLYKCSNIYAVLTSDSGAHYLWSTGDTTRTISVIDSGHYNVTSTLIDTCMVIMAHDFYILNHTDSLSLSSSVNKCRNAGITLTGDVAQHYLWSTGDTTNAITISDSGNYNVIETLTDTCLTIITHNYSITNYSYPPIVLHDTTFCTGDSITLNVGYTNAIWNTGVTGSMINIGTDGVYTVHALDSCGVLHTDSATITVNPCLERYCTIEFPNAFTPNKDGKNDIFKAISHGAFDNYYLQVFNRFGQCVFMTNDVTKGWDGIYNNAKADVGTYYYLCTFTCPLKGKQQFKGDVTLIR